MHWFPGAPITKCHEAGSLNSRKLSHHSVEAGRTSEVEEGAGLVFPVASVPGVWTAAPCVSACSLYVRLFLFTARPFCEVSVHLLAWSACALNVLSPRSSDQGIGFGRSLDLGDHGHLLRARSRCGSLGHCCSDCLVCVLQPFLWLYLRPHK